MKKTTNILASDIFIEAAESLGLNIEVIDSRSGFCVICNEDRRFLVKGNLTSLTDIAARSVINNITLRDRLLGKGGVKVHDDKDAVDNYSTRLKSYRALLLNGEIIDIIQRVPPSVIGNGSDPLARLLAHKNRKRKRARLKRILVDSGLLQKYRITSEDVIANQARVFLNTSNDFDKGGETRRIDMGSLDPQRISSLGTCAKLLSLNYCGIDFSCQDIYAPLSSIDQIIMDIHSCPNITMHYFTDKRDMTVPRKLLTSHFSMSSYGFIVTGKVQKVRYRKTLQERCKQLKFNGFIKNQKDRSVFAAVLCSESRISEFIRLLGEGSPKSKVQNIARASCQDIRRGGFRIHKTG